MIDWMITYFINLNLVTLNIIVMYRKCIRHFELLYQYLTEILGMQKKINKKKNIGQDCS